MELEIIAIALLVNTIWYLTYKYGEMVGYDKGIQYAQSLMEPIEKNTINEDL